MLRNVSAGTRLLRLVQNQSPISVFKRKCGICGWISFGRTTPSEGIRITTANGIGRPTAVAIEEDLKVVNLMNETLRNRGPDEQNVWKSSDGHCIFGHSRLIVVDPKGGKQPMIRDGTDGKYAITYNGELYNTDEVRNKLIQKGLKFETYSDTEVVLQSFIGWGPDCVQHLNGIFAFAIWHNDKVFIARDRLGVKPFFFSKRGGDFMFGSEIKALLQHPKVSSKVPMERMATMLSSSFFRPVGFLPFQDVEELKPGHVGYFSSDGLKVWKYWDFPTPTGNADSIEEASDKVYSLLKDAATRQMVSDVKYGCLVSGGIDSCAITHFVHKSIDDPAKMQTFSLQLPEYSKHFEPTAFRGDNDEDYIRLMNSKYKYQHHWIPVDSHDLIGAIEECTYAKEYPLVGDIDPSMYLLFKRIKPFASMVLSGEGSDEIFGGYKHLYIDKLYPGLPESTAASHGPLLRDEHQSKFDLMKEGLRVYEDTVASCPRVDGESEEELEFRKRLFLCVKTWLHAMLERKDRMSMGSSVEVRVPFTDHRLVEYLFCLPKAYKTYGKVEKYILKKSLERDSQFPEAIRNRKKSPYPTAVDPKTVSMSLDLLQGLLKSREDEPMFQWFDKKKLAAAVDDKFAETYKRTSKDAIFMCFNLYSFNLWLKRFNVKVS